VGARDEDGAISGWSLQYQYFLVYFKNNSVKAAGDKRFFYSQKNVFSFQSVYTYSQTKLIQI